MDEDGKGRPIATLEESVSIFDIADRTGFGYGPGVRYGMRIRYTFDDGTSSHAEDDDQCCYFKEVREPRVAASYFTRWFTDYGLSPSSRLSPFVSSRRQRRNPAPAPIAPISR